MDQEPTVGTSTTGSPETQSQTIARLEQKLFRAELTIEGLKRELELALRRLYSQSSPPVGTGATEGHTAHALYEQKQNKAVVSSKDPIPGEDRY